MHTLWKQLHNTKENSQYDLVFKTQEENQNSNQKSQRFTGSISLITKTRKYYLEAQEVEPQKAGIGLVLIGVAACVLDLSVGGILGSVYLGVSWILAGGIYFLAGRDVTEGGFLAALILGFIGAIIWVIVDTSNRGSADTSFRYSGKQVYYKKIAESNYKCCDCHWFGKPGCPRKKTQANAEPCTSFFL